MAISKRKLDRFIAIKEAVKEVASDSDLNEDLSDSLYLKTIGIKFLCALFLKNVCTVRDLAFSDTEDIMAAVGYSERATFRMTVGFRRLYLSYGNLSRIKENKAFIPDVYLTKTFSLLRKMNREQLTVLIGTDNIDNVRLLNAFAKADIITLQDLKDAGIAKVQNLPSLGKRSFKELLEAIENIYLSGDENIDDIIGRFRSYLLEASKEVANDFDIKPLEIKLYGYVSEFVDSLKLGRNGEIFKLRLEPDKMTLEKIAKRYGCTRERIRQIIATTNNKIASCFTNRYKAATIDQIKNFYCELMSIDKDVVLRPMCLLIQKKDVVSKILYSHFNAIGLLPNDVVIIKPIPENKRAYRKRKVKIIPDENIVNNILSTVEANNGKFRINKLANLLHGTFDVVFEKDYQENKGFFGLCKSYGVSHIINSIYYLLNEELLQQIKDGTYKLCITNDGRMVLEHIKQSYRKG